MSCLACGDGKRMVSFPTERMVYRFGGFTLDPASETLRAADGVPVALRAKSLALLELLVENAGHLLTREAIMDALWPNIFVTDDSITQCVRDIRSVLGRNSTAMLRTVRRRGYVFDAGAVRQDREQKAVTSADRPQSLGVSGPGIDRPVRLLVLPVHQWKSDDSDADKPLSRTVTEAIVADLVPLLLNLTSGEVQVLFRDDRLTHQQSAWQHDRPDYVLRGSIHDVYRTSLSLQLIDTSSWACIWAEQDQSCWAGNVLSRLVRGVAIALIRYIGSQMDAIPIQELSLHELLLRGNFHLLRPASRVSRRQALTCFEQALSKDQGSTAARLGIARAIVCSLTNSLSDDIAADEARSETLLLEVLQSSGDSGVAHTALGTLRRLQGRLEEAQVELSGRAF
jgi:DNA-binding winged helix-turn-helix (wHTH) protein